MPTKLIQSLEFFCQENRMFGKGPLAVALFVTRRAAAHSFPLNPDNFLAEKGGQVAGLGRNAVQSILNDNGITRILAHEGGRTSRGSIDNMRKYVFFLNQQYASGILDFTEIEQFWIAKVNLFFASQPFRVRLDQARSIRDIFKELLTTVCAKQSELSGTMVLGTVLQHLVGAKLSIALPQLDLVHQGASVADAPTDRRGDFIVGTTAIHVTSAPGESLLQKCSDNLAAGIRPLIITTQQGAGGALALAENLGLGERIEVLEIDQFLATNLYEWSGFADDRRTESVKTLIDKYNEIVETCETDPSLRIELG